jgi:hypothetical protein
MERLFAGHLNESFSLMCMQCRIALKRYKAKTYLQILCPAQHELEALFEIYQIKVF